MACEYHWTDYTNDVSINHPCQFPVSTPSVMSQGRPHCVWHAPVVDKLNWSTKQKQQFEQCFKSHLATLGAETRADFRGVVFPENVSFDGMALDMADFRNATFIADASFHKTRFSSTASFKAAQFLRNARFDEATFLGVTEFDHAKFSGNLDCLNATFEHDATFPQSEILGHAHFGGTRFHAMALFEQTQFRGLGSFSRVTFHRANFHKASIASNATFSNCTFGMPALFIDTTFGYGTEFDWAVFMQDAHFDCRLPETARLPRTSWQNTRFSRNVSFNNRIFTTHADFSETVFEKAPTYHGCTFHEAMLFPPQSNFRDRAGKRASEAYRTLRLAMQEMSAHLEAGKFYALEEESRRNTPGEMKRHERLLSLLYGAFSDYGRNALRPLGFVLALLICLAPIYALANSAPLALSSSFDGKLLTQGLNFSLQQVVSPFALWREPSRGSLLDGIATVPSWVI